MFGIKIKKGFSKTNLMSIPVVTCGALGMSSYISSQMIFMLSDPNYQDVDSSDIGNMTSYLTLCAYPGIILCFSVMGYMFDILGRRITLFILFTLSSIGIVLIPYSGKSITWLFIAKATVQPLLVAISGMPLIMDIVKKESRGKATVLNLIGLVFGEAIAYGGLLNFTSNMDYKIAFKLAAGYLFFWQIFIYLLVKEPDLSKIKKSRKEKIEQRKQLKLSEKKEILQN
jgi:MFS family permease